MKIMFHALTLGWMVFAAAATLLGCGSGESSSMGADPLAGAALFHDRAPAGLEGNGRACSDCHIDGSGFQLAPADVEARFQQMTATGIDDPLFRPIDADDFTTHGNAATD